jgi:AcrR family transcriptional regulator
VAFVRTPRQQWIENGMAALATGGPDAVRIEVLARELGVTKGGFYGHFADRQALLDEVLDTWERSSVDDVMIRAWRRATATGDDSETRGAPRWSS